MVGLALGEWKVTSVTKSGPIADGGGGIEVRVHRVTGDGEGRCGDGDVLQIAEIFLRDHVTGIGVAAVGLLEGIALRREEQRRAGGILAAVSDAGEGTAGDGQISAVGGQIHPVELAAGDGDMAAQHQNGAVPPQLTATLTVADGETGVDHQVVGAGEGLAVEIQRIGAGGEAHAAPEGILSRVMAEPSSAAAYWAASSKMAK